ncbi:MAG: hypothetical protein QM535_17420 [Limnohabitans sp.]|nr:hypothetical protein [Limnohabitans sp.]
MVRHSSTSSSVKKVSVVPVVEEHENGNHDHIGEEESYNEMTGDGIGVDANLETRVPSSSTFKQTSSRDRANLKMINLLRVMSKLANIKAYDEEGRIKTKDGKFLQNSDVAYLLLNAMSPGKIVIGEEEFILLLKSAQVNPDLILNENIRQKLMNLPFSTVFFKELPSEEIEEDIRVIKTNEPGTAVSEELVINKPASVKRKIDASDTEDVNKEEKIITQPVKKVKKSNGNGVPEKWFIPPE